MKRFLLDTDILIDFLKGHKAAVQFFERLETPNTLAISAITVAELSAGVRNKKELEEIKGFIRAFESISVSYDVAIAAGELKNQYFKSHGLGLADAVIAATCSIHQFELCTLNVKHYPMLKNLKPAYKKSTSAG